MKSMFLLIAAVAFFDQASAPQLPAADAEMPIVAIPGKRQTRDNMVPNVTPMDRLPSRIQNRIDSRIQSRISGTQAEATAAFALADQRSRQTSGY